MTTTTKNSKRSPSIAFVQTLDQLAKLVQRSSPSDDAALEQQKLYESWLRRDEWLLRAEAIPLLLGADPEGWESRIDREKLQQAEQAAWDSLNACIKEKGFSALLNPEAPDDEWQATPSEFYRWSTSLGVIVPQPFDALVQFILQVLKTPSPSDENSPLFGSGESPQSGAGDREKVLGAALNILAKCPEKCRDEHGLVSGDAIVGMIGEQSIRWFDTPEPPLTPSDMAALIEKWLE